jgi:hypothetical protein
MMMAVTIPMDSHTRIPPLVEWPLTQWKELHCGLVILQIRVDLDAGSAGKPLGELSLHIDCWKIASRRLAKTVAFLCFLSLPTAAAVRAQELPSPPDVVVSDLNVVATYLSKETLLNSEVMNIVAVTCSTMGVAREKRIGAQLGSMFTKNYPPADEISKIELNEFVKFERETFAKFGASEQSVVLVERAIRTTPQFPTELPSTDSLDNTISTLENLACELKAKPIASLAQPASGDTTKLAFSLGLAVVGLAAMTVDGLALVQSPAVPVVIVFSMASGGWGWNRVEQSVSEVKELWNSAFN